MLPYTRDVALRSSQFFKHLKWMNPTEPLHLQATMQGFSRVLSDPQQYLHYPVFVELLG
jgi:hypothetical protein